MMAEPGAKEPGGRDIAPIPAAGPHERTAQPPPGPSVRQGWARRGLLAGLVAGAGGLTSRLLAPGRAEATHGGGTDPTALHVNQFNTAADTTTLQKSGQVNSNEALKVMGGDGLKPTTGVVGIAGVASTNSSIFNRAGVMGHTFGFTGVLGIGSASSGVGVQGISDNTDAVIGWAQGSAGASSNFAGGPAAGVLGYSGFTPGVVGQTAAPANTVAAGNVRVAGVLGRANKNVGVYGYDQGGANGAASYGVAGQSDSAYGLFGYSGAGAGSTVSSPTGQPAGQVAVAGIFGTAPSVPGVYGISTTSIGVAGQSQNIGVFGAVLPGAGAGALAGLFIGNVQIQGHLQVTGGVNGPTAAVQGDSRGATGATTGLQAMQSRDAVVEDFGEGRLTAGQADVRLDAAVLALLADDQYHVFLTEYGDHNGLYVARRNREGFQVRAKDSPTANGTFSYRVVGKRRDVAAAATRPDTFEVRPPPIPAPASAPTLPTPDLVTRPPQTEQRGPTSSPPR
jgi:hypothetical protein